MYWRLSNDRRADPEVEPQTVAGGAGGVEPARQWDSIHFVATYVPLVLILLWDWRLFIAIVLMASLVGLFAAWSQRGHEQEP